MATAVPDDRARGGVQHIDLDDSADWPEVTDPEEGDR
jgi:hypothetical protein